jgi:hypothetical protein
VRLGHRRDDQCEMERYHDKHRMGSEIGNMMARHRQIIARFSVAGLRLRLHFRPESWNF